MAVGELQEVDWEHVEVIKVVVDDCFNEGVVVSGKDVDYQFLDHWEQNAVDLS